jgi:hypothetical protein
MYASRPTSASELRPRRRWLLVPAAILAGGITATILIAISLFSGTSPKRTFVAGETVTIDLTRDPRPGFYVSDEGASTDRCYARDASGRQYEAEHITGTMTITVNGQKWNVLSHIALPANGTYQVTCDKTDANASARYGVGYPPETGAFVGGILAVVLIPLISFFAAVGITIVIFVRRNTYRRRLLTPPPAPPYYQSGY